MALSSQINCPWDSIIDFNTDNALACSSGIITCFSQYYCPLGQSMNHIMPYTQVTYLHILSDVNQRKSLTKFRISNHKLKIETGIYSKPITPLENSICEKCFSDEIESEEHLLLKCSFYYASRRKLLETIKNNNNHSNFEKIIIWG